MVDPHEEIMLYDPYEFFDELTGQSLDESIGKRGQEVGDAVLQEHAVLRQGAQMDWYARDSCKVLTTRWLDINKGDQQNLELQRPGCAGREMKTDSRLELFAATPPPPLKFLRMVCSMCVRASQARKNPYSDNVD